MEKARAIFVQVPNNDRETRGLSNEVQAIAASRTLEVAVERGFISKRFVQREVERVEERLQDETNMELLSSRYGIQADDIMFRGTSYLRDRISRISEPDFFRRLTIGVRRVFNG